MLRFAALTLTLTLTLLCAVAPAHAQPLDGRLKQIAASKTIRIAHRTDARPFSFLDENKQPAGYTVDLCKRVASLIAEQVNVKDLAIKWVPVTVQDRFAAIQEGRADMLCGVTTVTLGRMKLVDFSHYIFADSTGLLARKAAGIRSMEEAAGKQIGAISGTTNEKALADMNQRLNLGLKMVAIKSRDEGFAALEEGRIDGFVTDRLLLTARAAQMKDARNYVLLPEDLSLEPYAIALPRGDNNFRLAVNTGLAQVYRSGEIVAIYGRWFSALGEPTGLMKAMFQLGSLAD